MPSHRLQVHFRKLFAPYGSRTATRGFAPAQILPTTERIDANINQDQGINAVIPQDEDPPTPKDTPEPPHAIDTVGEHTSRENTLQHTLLPILPTLPQDEEIELDFLCLYIA
jgi:hypothetical protein